MDYGFTVLRWLSSGSMYADTILESLKPRSKPVDSKFCIGDIVWHKEYQWRGKAYALVGHFVMEVNFFWLGISFDTFTVQGTEMRNPS